MESFERLERQTKWLKAIAHPIRIAIVKRLIEINESSVNSMKDALELPQSTVSQHLQVMKTSGIVTSQRKGTTVLYSVNNKTVKKLIKLLDELN